MQFSTVFVTLFALASVQAADAISQINDGQIQATTGAATTPAATTPAATIEKQTTAETTATVHQEQPAGNAAGKVAAGMGAGAVAAAALFL